MLFTNILKTGQAVRRSPRGKRSRPEEALRAVEGHIRQTYPPRPNEGDAEEFQEQGTELLIYFFEKKKKIKSDCKFEKICWDK